MGRIAFLVICLFMIVNTVSYANEINYSNCQSLQDVIVKESQEIATTNPTDHAELAQLYVSRGESYLLATQYEKAVEDFQNADSHSNYSNDNDTVAIVAFRIAFGQAVCYDNLGMQEHTEQAIQQLQTILSHIGCNDCKEDHPCQKLITPSVNRFHFRNITTPASNILHFHNKIMLSRNKKNKQENQEPQNQDNYDDILGPNIPPEPSWCEEVITGTGRAMEAIACLAQNHAVKVVLIGVIEVLITRGVKCCEAGGLWKACVAPIVRKWREWKNNKEKHISPNAQNLSQYT